MESLFNSILAELLPVTAAILTALLSYGILLLTSHFKIKVSQEHEDLIRLSVRKAIGGAEEWAARQLGLEDVEVSGFEKTIWVRDRVRMYYPDLTDDELDRLIDEELAALPRVGATQEKVV